MAQMLEKLGDLIRGRRGPHGGPPPPPPGPPPPMPPMPPHGPPPHAVHSGMAHGHSSMGSSRSSFHQQQYPPPGLQASPLSSPSLGGGGPRLSGADFGHGAPYGLPPGYGLPAPPSTAGPTASTAVLPSGGSAALPSWYSAAIPYSTVPGHAVVSQSAYDPSAGAPANAATAPLALPQTLSAMAPLPAPQGLADYRPVGRSGPALPATAVAAPASAGPFTSAFATLQPPGAEPPQSPPVSVAPPGPGPRGKGEVDPSPRRRLSVPRDAAAAAASPTYRPGAAEFAKGVPPLAAPPSPTLPPPGSAASPAAGRGQALAMDFHARRERGSRPYLEDTTAAKVFDGGLLLGVFDGHGGGKAADYCRTHLLDSVATWLGARPDSVPAAMTAAFRQTDEQFVELARQYGWPDGSTALVACIQEGWLHVAHCGDTRLLLVRDGAAGYAQLTEDHRPGRPQERDRIVQAGGSVQVRPGDTARVVPGFLAVSRSIGDVRAKPIVIADPEVQSLQMDRSWRALVLATDGLWDVVSPALCADICLRSATAHQAADQLVTTAVAMHSTDNITALVVLIRPA